jgi:hypothetical protein
VKGGDGLEEFMSSASRVLDSLGGAVPPPVPVND